MDPTIGRIVRYHPHPQLDAGDLLGPGPFPAIVVAVHGDRAGLQVFGEAHGAIVHRAWVAQGEGPGCWSWPPLAVAGRVGA